MAKITRKEAIELLEKHKKLTKVTSYTPESEALIKDTIDKGGVFIQPPTKRAVVYGDPLVEFDD